jgi:hypothetical protein
VERTGRGAVGQATTARRPDSASAELRCASAMVGTVGPATTGPSPKDMEIFRSTSSVGSVVSPASTTISREPCTPSSTGRLTRAARLRTS